MLYIILIACNSEESYMPMSTSVFKYLKVISKRPVSVIFASKCQALGKDAITTHYNIFD
jgi:hypothetical protein